MIPFSDSRVEKVYHSYPEYVQPSMLALRDLIYTTHKKLVSDGELTECLKWGEPSYVSKNGSPVRIHWKENDSDCYRMFFHCQTSLVETFRELYPSAFIFEGNRAIRFQFGAEIDLAKLEHCVQLALVYHLVKHLPQLGVKTLDLVKER